MRLLVVGPNGAGKTTVSRQLRAAGLPVVDLDDELVRLNGGVYPDDETRKNVVAPQAWANVKAMPKVVVLHAVLTPEEVSGLRSAGFTTALLEVAEPELRRRHQKRLAEEGWSNEEWLHANLALIESLREHDLFDHIIDAQQEAVAVAKDVLRLAGGSQRAAPPIGTTGRRQPGGNVAPDQRGQRAARL